MTQVKFNNEDCFVTMDNLISEGKKVDIVLTSPPYNTGRQSNSERSLSNHEARYDIYLDNKTDDEYCEWTTQLFNKFDEVLNKNGVILYNISYGNEQPNACWLILSEIIRNTPFMIADCIIWKKHTALPNNVSKNRLTRITEFVFVICRKNELKTFNAIKKKTSQSKTGQQYYENVYNFIDAANNDGSTKLNKATFSSDLVSQLLNIYANENSIIYDPFMGTGTTAVGCLKYNNGDNNMIVYGSELSPAQVEYSKERYEKVEKEVSFSKRQQSLF